MRSLLALVATVLVSAPVLPPGDSQPIVPPLPTPAVAPATEPTPDPHVNDVVPFDVTAEIGGMKVDDAVVTLHIGETLVLSTTGSAVTTTTPVTWALNQKNAHYHQFYDGRTCTLSATSESTWLATAAVNSADATKPPLLVSKWIVVPPYGPAPEPTPPKPDDVKPLPGDGLRVLILYESTKLQNLPAAQQDAINSTTVRTYLDSHCAKEADGAPAYRIWDDDVDATNDPAWKQALSDAPKDDQPYIRISDGKKGFKGPLPADEAGLMKLLTQYGGS